MLQRVGALALWADRDAIMQHCLLEVLDAHVETVKKPMEDDAFFLTASNIGEAVGLTAKRTTDHLDVLEHDNLVHSVTFDVTTVYTLTQQGKVAMVDRRRLKTSVEFRSNILNSGVAIVASIIATILSIIALVRS